MHNYKDISNELITVAKISKEDIFDYDFSPLKSIFEQYFQFCQTNLSEHSNEHSIQPAKFYYVERNGVNAIAGVQNGYYIIGVFKETITRLYDLFYEQNNVFEDDIELKKYSTLKTLNVPLGFLMFQTASLFTYYHEQGHLIQKSDYLASWLNEQYLENNERPYSQEKHVLEFDADLNGAHFICYHLIDYWKKQEQTFQTQENFQMMLSLGAASVFSYFMLLQTNSQDIYYKKYWHPHPVVRISYIIDCFIKVAEINLPDNIQIDSNLTLTEAFKISDKFFTTVLKNDIVSKFISVYSSETGNIQTYITELIELSKLNPALVRHKTVYPKKKINSG